MSAPALDAISAEPAGAGLFLDYDGTLAPIVADPAAAVPVPGVSELLGELARRLGVVAVVSGRRASFLVEMLGRPRGVRLVGLYGMEEVSDGAVVVAEEAAAWGQRVADALRSARAAAPPGVRVEDKGYSLTLHWRGTPEAAAEGAQLARRLETASGLVGHPGRASVELRPPIPLDKGTVVRRLGAGCDPVAYFGDDVGDLPAFAALDEFAAGGARVAKIVVVAAESDPGVLAAADLTLDGPEAAVALLGSLARQA
jgi:trehalose 6-phosphate phosphatase